MPDMSTPADELDLITLLREDRVINGYSVFKPGFQVLAVHRFGVRERTYSPAVRRFTTPLYKALHILVRNLYGIEIERTVKIGRRVVIGHQSGIVVHPFARIGDDVILRQNNTLGGVSLVQEDWAGEGPILEDGVTLGAGAVILGKVTIGAGARIGPNAVVSKNIPAGAVVMAPPPRVIRPSTRDADTPENEM